MSSYARFAGITGAAADLAASRKEAKYTSLTNSYIFSQSQWNPTVRSGQVASPSLPVTTLGKRLTAISGDLRETPHLFQKLSIITQRFNTVLKSATRALFLPTKSGPFAIPTFDSSFLSYCF